MEHKRRSVIRLLFNDDNNNNATEVSGWMNALKNLDGPEMPFDEMLELKSEMDKSMKDSKENTEKRSRRYKHFDLRVRKRLLCSRARGARKAAAIALRRCSSCVHRYRSKPMICTGI